MATRIASKITNFRVEKPVEAVAPAAPKEPSAILMHEKIERPEVLVGSTYKVKTPVSDHAMYVTINDILLNEGTSHEQRQPFEIFINTKNLDHYPWIVALTRVVSSVFRKGGDVTFLVEELKGVFDPKGGYWQPGGRFVPSVIAELGHIIELHLRSIGLMQKPELEPAQLQLIAEKREQYLASKTVKPAAAVTPSAGSSSANAAGVVPGAMLCPKCQTKALVLMDGCRTCLNCGDSKCG